MTDRKFLIVWIFIAALAIIASKTYFGVSRLIEQADWTSAVMRVR